MASALARYAGGMLFVGLLAFLAIAELTAEIAAQYLLAFRCRYMARGAMANTLRTVP